MHICINYPHTKVCTCAYNSVLDTPITTPHTPGLAVASPIDNAELFSLVECVEDLWLKIFAFFWEKDETRKVGVMLRQKTLAPQHNCMHAQAAAKKQFTENYLPLTLKKLETTAALNDSKEGWIKGDKVMMDKLFVTVDDNQDYGHPIHFSLLLKSSLYSLDNTHLHIR